MKYTHTDFYAFHFADSFACSHQRATAYYLESIRSPKGFWGWACSSYIAFLLGMCPPTNYLLEAGDNVRPSTRGMFLVDTNDSSPYALGKWTDLPTLGVKYHRRPPQMLKLPPQSVDPLLQHIDEFGKLATNFNNLPSTHFGHDPYEHWTSYSPPNQQEKESNDSVEEQDSAEFVEVNNRQLTPLNWWDYRRNLTHGYIDNNVFSLPNVH